MSGFACCFWWFLLGLLLGWLLNWLLSKWMRSDEPTITSMATAYSAPTASVATSVAAATVGVNVLAASAAGFSVKGDDDLPIIEGIGPKISELLKSHDVSTFAKLSTMSVAEISAILDQGGARFKLANPGSWAQQAKLCHENRWTELKALQDELYAGVEVTNGDGSSAAPKA